MTRRRLAFTLFCVTAFVADPLTGQGFDSVRGAQALRDQGCTNCHAVLGYEGGSGRAPDLGRSRPGGYSPLEFAAELWNHSPEMWAAAERQGEAAPMLDRQQARDVFAYLYSVRYFEPAGDAARGRTVFDRKGCYRCHALIKTDAGGIGPAVADWPLLDDPVRFLEAMWNHGAAMVEESRIDRAEWPELDTRELSDMIAYVYDLPDLPPRRAVVRLGAPSAGMRSFDDLGCANCHTLLSGDPDLIPLSDAPRKHRTLTGLAVEMWNHRPIMEEWSAETGIALRPMEDGQMAGLLSYLFEEGLLEERGNADRGRRVYEASRCASCHDQQPLPKREWRATDLVSGVWSHAPEMRERMRREGVAWPSLSAEQMADLIAWLNAR